jgi:bacillithiol system protein YtxJ
MNFTTLETEEQLAEIKGSKGYNIIFKHNTTCPISKGVKRSLEEDGDNLPKGVPVYILDLLSHRNISDAIAENFSVEHQSPQLLVIKDGQCSYHKALYDITVEDTTAAINEK